MTVGLRTNPFPTSSIWKKRLPDSVQPHDLSDAYVASIARQAHEYFTATINNDAYSVGTFTAPWNAPRVQVQFSGTGRVAPQWVEQMSNVPLPPDLQPPTGTDGSIVIWHPNSNTLWELWRAENRDGHWFARWGGRIEQASRSSGVFPFPYGVCASGLSMAGGMLRIKELQAGEINHCVSVGLPEVRKGVFVPPANRNDGRTDDVNAIPEGQRFRLDPTLDLDSLKLSRVARMIAVAAQRFGLIVSDYSGAVAFGGENEKQFAVNPWPELFDGLPRYKVLDRFPWERLIALA